MLKRPAPPAAVQLALFPPEEEEIIWNLYQRRMTLQDELDKARCKCSTDPIINVLCKRIWTIEDQELRMKQRMKQRMEEKERGRRK